MRFNKPKRVICLLPAVLLLAFFVFCAPAQAAETSTTTDDSALKKIDTDKDGLKDWDELHIYHTDPNNPDTDNDGHQDKKEIYYGYSPRHQEPLKLSSIDSDNDGLPDSWEIRLKTDLLDPDQNGNGIKDGDDVNNGFDPKDENPVLAEKTIRVSVKDQWLAYYFNGVKLDEFAVSTGKKTTPTPLGEFEILEKVPVKHYKGPGYDYPNAKWNLHFTTKKYRYYIHGAYWHNKFGRTVSSGCVNVRYVNMERLYDFAEVGTKVLIN